MKKKRTHLGRQPVLLDRDASPIVKKLAADQDRSMNYVASKAVKQYKKCPIPELELGEDGSLRCSLCLRRIQPDDDQI